MVQCPPMKKTLLIVVSLFAFVGCAQKSTSDTAAGTPKTEPAKATKDTKAPKEKAKTKVDPAKPKPASAASGPAGKAATPKAPAPKAGIPAPADVAAAPADAVKTASGLASKVLKAGTGKKKPKATDTVKVHYTGWTTDGKMFDSSVMRGQPTSFPLNRVIKGWTEGVALMVEGEKRRFWIPGNLAYGDTPSRPGAPAGTLVFDVELLEIEKAPSPEEVKAQFAAFAKAVKAGADEVCKCKDMTCVQMSMMKMTQVRPPKGQPTPEQIAQVSPDMKRLQDCGQKIQAASRPAAPAGKAAPAKAPAPAGKK